MATRNPQTDYYSVEVTVKFVERNQYHDVLNEGVLTFTQKTRTNLTGLSEMIVQLDRAVKGASINSD